MSSIAGAVQALADKKGLERYEDLLPPQLPKPDVWDDAKKEIEQTARLCFEDAVLRAARREGRELAEEMFGSNNK